MSNLRVKYSCFGENEFFWSGWSFPHFVFRWRTVEKRFCKIVTLGSPVITPRLRFWPIRIKEPFLPPACPTARCPPLPHTVLTPSLLLLPLTPCHGGRGRGQLQAWWRQQHEQPVPQRWWQEVAVWAFQITAPRLFPMCLILQVFLFATRFSWGGL